MHKKYAYFIHEYVFILTDIYIQTYIHISVLCSLTFGLCFDYRRFNSHTNGSLASYLPLV